jgi:putative hemolysin
MDAMLEYVPILVILLILSSLFSSAETAFLSLQRMKLEHYVREGRSGAQAVANLLERPRRLLSAILVGNNLVNTGTAIVGGLIAQRIVSGGVGALLAAITVTILLVIFGEVAPKTIALQHNFALSRAYAIPMTIWAKLMRPIVAVLDALARVIMSILGGDGESEERRVSEAELRMLIGISAETGSVAEAEAELLHKVFQFGDRQVHEVMVPRTETVWLPKGTKVRDFYQVFAEAPHSRFPMFEGDLDHVQGIIGIKDVLRSVARGEMDEDDPVDRVLRPTYFIPETKGIAELFREMQAKGHQMAIAVDEWGGTAGIVTIELLLEEMVGRVRDELLASEEEIRTIDAETMQVDGSLSVDEAREGLGLDIPEGPYDTIAGFVLSVLGHIPREGEFVVLDGHQITVAEMRGLKIESLRVTRV